MAKSKSKKNNGDLFMALLYIVLGILFIVFRGGMLNWMMTIAGILFIVVGAVSLFTGDVIGGIIAIAIGILILVGGWLFVELVLLILGILLAIRGLVGLVASCKPFSMIGVLFSILTVAVGVLLIVAHWVVLDWFFIVIGALLIVSGIFELAGKKVGK